MKEEIHLAKRLVGGVFDHQDNVVKSIEALKVLGYEKEDISVFAKSKEDVKEIEANTDVDITREGGHKGKNSGKGLGVGAGTGGVLGGIAGIIAEIGLLTIPGIGVIVAAGPIATTLSGAAIGAGGGSIIGALTGAGISEDEAKQYEKYLKEGHILLMVEVDETREKTVQDTFADHHTLNTNMYPSYR